MQRATFFLTHGPTHTSYLVSFAERALPSKGVDIGFAAGGCIYSNAGASAMHVGK